MKNKKSSTDKTIAANRANARKSTGPKTCVGKRYSRMNACKHRFFASELRITEADRPAFEVMRDGLLQQLAPATPMQQIAFDKIVCCSWRCRLALQMESLALQRSLKQEAPVEAGGGETMLLETWYGCDHRSLQDALRFLQGLRADVAQNGLLHLEQDGTLKESLIKGFGPGFYSRLMEWRGLDVRMISLAEHLAYMMKNFRLTPLSSDFLGECAEHWAAMRETQELKPPATDQSPQGLQDRQLPKIVKDPAQLREMAEKLIDAQIEHLEMLDRTRGQHFGQTPQAVAEFSPRFYADACRDLHRAVDWFLKIKEAGL